MFLAFLSAGQPSISQDSQLRACSTLCESLKHSQHILAASAAAALGHAGLRRPLPLPLSPEAPDKGVSAASGGATDNKSTSGNASAPDAKRAKSPSDDKQAAPSTSGTAAAAATAAASSGQSGVSSSKGAATPAAEETAAWTVQKAMGMVVGLMKDKDVKVAQRAATAAGHLCAGQPVRAVLDPALEGLFALGFNKNEDVLFTVGEALCFAFGGEMLLLLLLQVCRGVYNHK